MKIKHTVRGTLLILLCIMAALSSTQMNVAELQGKGITDAQQYGHYAMVGIWIIGNAIELILFTIACIEWYRTPAPCNLKVKFK